MKLHKFYLVFGLAAFLAGCSSKEVDLNSSPYSQADVIKDMGGSYKVGSPYQIMGQWYYPQEDYNYSEEGMASWYGEDFHAKKTANGEDYDMNSLTAAHRTLPLPSIVRVTNMENGRSLVLRVNDRGPYVKNRIIDVSKRAAELLGFKSKGTAKVRVEILPKESLALKQALVEQDFEPNYALYNAKDEAYSGEVPPPASLQPVDRNYLVGAGASGVQASQPKPATVVVEQKTQPAPVAVVAPSSSGGKKFFVQAGAFSQQELAYRLSAQLKREGTVTVSQVEVNGNSFYRVRLGPYNAQADAEYVSGRLADYGINDARIVKD